MDQHDKRINWKQKYSILEQNKAAADQKTFDDCFDDAIKLSDKLNEIEQLKQKIQCQEIPIPPPPISHDNSVSYTNAFIHDGDAWVIWFQGTKLKPIKEMDGMTYIATLLSKPNQIIHVTTLCDSVSPQRRNEAMMDEEDLTDSLHEGNMFISTMQDDDGLKDEVKETLRKQIIELKETQNDKYLPHSERQKASQELQKIMKIINNQYGKRALAKKPPEKVNDGVKKDLDRTLKAIKRAYNEINKQLPKLYKYLKDNIRPGTQYLFIDKDTIWIISI